MHLCYVGTLLPTGAGTLRLLLRGLARARRDDPAASRLRVHFFGTSNQSDSDVHRVLPMAREYGVGRRRDRTAGTARLPGCAVGADTGFRRSCCSAAAERHYTASKLYPALLAKRPILALFHEASSVVSILRAAASEPSVRVLTYGDGEVGDELVDAVVCHLRALAANARLPRRRCRPRAHRGRVGASSRAAAGSGLRSGGGMTDPVRLTAVLTHPIQYYAPWFRRIHANGAGTGADRRARHRADAGTAGRRLRSSVRMGRAAHRRLPVDRRAAGQRARSDRQRLVHRPRRAGDRPRHRRHRAGRRHDHRLVFGDADPRAVGVPPAGCPDALSWRLASAQRTGRVEKAVLGAQDAHPPAPVRRVPLAGRPRAGISASGTACRTIASSRCRTRWTTRCSRPRPRRTSIPMSRAAARRRWGIDPEAFVALFVGKLVGIQAAVERRARRSAAGAGRDARRRRFRPARRGASCRSRSGWTSP